MEMNEMHPGTKQYFNFGEGDCCGGGWGGGNNLFTILLLFCLFGGGGFGGFGGWGNRGGVVGADLAANSAASIARNEAGLDFLGQTLVGQGNKLDVMNSNITGGTAAIQAALCQGFNGLNTAILESKYDLSRSIDTCCCQTQQNIAALNANLDKVACAIISSGKDNTQAILSALCSHWREDDQRIINKLEQQLNAANIISALKPAATTAAAGA
jgi:hypothetical protein